MTADELYQQAFRGEVAALKPATLCDIGCGDGTLVAHARTLGIAAVGIEPDAARIAGGRAAGLDLREGTAEALPFPDDSFDVVTFENSLHHVGEIGRALAESMRVTRRAVVVIDPWFDRSIPSQRVGDRLERWSKKLDRITGMVHWDPIAAGEIIACCSSTSATVRHLLQLTTMSSTMFDWHVSRADSHKGAAAYKANKMDEEVAAIRAEFERISITEAGSLLVTLMK
jgi:ubiquinone/menaquinone biosynthesis C-methylase UbiE